LFSFEAIVIRGLTLSQGFALNLTVVGVNAWGILLDKEQPPLGSKQNQVSKSVLRCRSFGGCASYQLLSNSKRDGTSYFSGTPAPKLN